MGFFEEYFIDPITTGSGYNIYNTVTYAILLIVAAFIVYRLMKKMNIKIDRDFFIGIMPFIAMGGITRALEDAGVLPRPYFVTPLIYVIIFFVAFGSLIASKMQKKFRYHSTWFAIGAVIDVILLGLVALKFSNPAGLALMLGITAAWAIVFALVYKFKLKRDFFTKENIFIIMIHMFDATTTFVSIQFYPYVEQHVLPNFLIGYFGPAVMFPLKLGVVSLVLYALDKELKTEPEKRTFLKIVVTILGMGPGVRNFLRLVMGV